MKKLSNVNIDNIQALPSPNEYNQQISITDETVSLVSEGRKTLNNILNGSDDRFLIIAGPCSIHDIEAGTEYAKKLKQLSDELSSKIVIVMRVYFEKPRTTVGWKGMIYDPDLNGSFDIESGLLKARSFLKDISDLGVLCATEFVDPITPQYIADFVSWAAIGARTAESQTHRQMASGLSMPVGFKNGTGGSIQLAVDAIVSSSSKHGFLGVDSNGNASMVLTKGNPNSHLVLRGGSSGPNYDSKSVEMSIELLQKANVNNHLIIDCSHANSGKDYRNEPKVFESVFQQRLKGNSKIIGVMLESHINAGSQDHDEANPDKLDYGVSITDSCLGWTETEQLLKDAYSRL